MFEQLLSTGKKGQVPFLGEVLAANFITGPTLASSVGLTFGTDMNVGEPWLHFKHLGKDLYIAKKPLRHSVTWNNLSGAGVVTGTKTVVIGADTYKVRLITGGPTAPGDGSEWNSLIYRIHVDNPVGARWANYTDADLGISTATNGYFTQCQEASSQNASNNVIRGSSLTAHNANNKGTGGTTRGWRPVLEKV